jgi:hypothetical protein
VIATRPSQVVSHKTTSLTLDYRGKAGRRNVRVALPPFSESLYRVPNRILDLLELAVYVYAADRHSSRGSKAAVEYHAWSRAFDVHMKVRDYAFWSRRAVRRLLGATLAFLSGDAEWQFTFTRGHNTPARTLFDTSGFIPPTIANAKVALFSGGLDSLAGALAVLGNETSRLLLVSHQSQAGTIKTQRALIGALSERYPHRVSHYPFKANLTGARAEEETQRTRSFLYTSIAFALASATGNHSFSVFENGVSSLNFMRRQDLLHARASRTTHPKALAMLADLFSEVGDAAFAIEQPYVLNTKADLVQQILSGPHADLISSTVSCSRTFRRIGPATHCGECFQCVDRRLATFAVGAEEFDHDGLYSRNIISEPVHDREARTTLIDYLRQARHFNLSNVDAFVDAQFTELDLVSDHLAGIRGEDESIDAVWRLCSRHGASVRDAIGRMRAVRHDPLEPLAPLSLLGLVGGGEHVKSPADRFADAVERIVRPAIAPMFALQRPTGEPDLNAKLGALLSSHFPELRSEHPAVSFAMARVIPDHELPSINVLIETKFVRAGTPPSKASDGMAADLTKYPVECHILFIVYDPDRSIVNDERFGSDFEGRGRCRVLVVR